jgi:hypothetical protein
MVIVDWVSEALSIVHVLAAGSSGLCEVALLVLYHILNLPAFPEMVASKFLPSSPLSRSLTPIAYRPWLHAKP